MAAEIQIGGTETDRIFLGTDGTRKFHVKDLDTDATGATAKDIAGKTIVLLIRSKDASTATVLTATCTITGTFNSVAASNTQRAVWTFLDTELTTAAFGKSGGTFRYSLKDTTDGGETILQFGDIVIDRATQI